MSYSKQNHGFTLIELLVVVAIIGMLSSIITASLNSARAKARDARRVSDLKQLNMAIMLYYDDNNNQWPCTGITGNDTYIDDQSHCLASELVPKYIPSIPTDPKYGGDGAKEWGNDYQYAYSTTLGGSYNLRTALESSFLKQNAGYPDGTTCQNGYAKCGWTGGDCVYLTGSSCEVVWFHLGQQNSY